jgi:hypothetical protein
MQNKKNRLIIFGLMLFISFDVVPSSESDTDDGYDSDRSFKELIATHIAFNPKKRKALELSSVDPELQYDINFSADSMNRRSLPFRNYQITPRCLMNDFIEEFVSKKEELIHSQSLNSRPIFQGNWQKMIKKGENKKLEKYLKSLPCNTIEVNHAGQNAAHIAAITPGGEYSLFLIARICPCLFALKDGQGNLPQDLIPEQNKRDTKKWKTVLRVQAAIGLTAKK